MENFEKYFTTQYERPCIGRAAFIVLTQHPKTEIRDLARRYGFHKNTLEAYRRWMNGTHTQPIPNHIQDVWDELYYECKKSYVLKPKEIKHLMSLHKSRRTKKDPEQTYIDLAHGDQTEILTKEEKQALVQPKDYVEITDREIRSNRLMYFAGVMTGIALLFLFVIIERV